MSTDVLAVLENARARLVATQQRADEVEAHARRILDTLDREAEAWREAVEQEHQIVGDVAARLSQRWSTLEDRISALATRATGEWNSLGESFAGHWDSVQQQLSDCATRLQVVQETLGQHQKSCETSREDHRGFGSTHAMVLSDAGEHLRKLAIDENQAIAQSFVETTEKCQTEIDQSLDQHRQQVDSTASEIGSRREEAISQIGERRSEFESEMDDKFQAFEGEVGERIDHLKATANSTKSSMEEAAEAIGTVTSTLVDGADDVVEVLNVTNIGLNTVVDIVQTAIEICDEVIDCWEN